MSKRHSPLILPIFICFDLLLFSCLIAVKVYFQPRVVIVPHHDVVKLERHEVLQTVAKKRFQTNTIILLSPDHFNPNQHQITSSREDWTTSQGFINSDQTLNHILSPLVNQDINAVKSDHGIYALLPDIKTIFPNAKLVPILLGQQLKSQDLKPLEITLNQSCRSDCLIIASVDFSHYLPATLANIHDAFSLKVLSALNLNQVMNLEVDSPQALFLALSHALAQNTSHFVLAKHTNSGEIMNNFDMETTSHVMGWYEPGQSQIQSTNTFVYAIDLMPTDNKKTVGDRFFYGAGLTDTKLVASQSPAPNLYINPIAGSTSTISTDGQTLTANLASDLSVAGLVVDDRWQLVFLPLSGIGNDRLLARGPLKQVALSRLLIDISSPFQTDLKRGTVTYSTGSAMLEK